MTALINHPSFLLFVFAVVCLVMIFIPGIKPVKRNIKTLHGAKN